LCYWLLLLLCSFMSNFTQELVDFLVVSMFNSKKIYWICLMIIEGFSMRCILLIGKFKWIKVSKCTISYIPVDIDSRNCHLSLEAGLYNIDHSSKELLFRFEYRIRLWRKVFPLIYQNSYMNSFVFLFKKISKFNRFK
jgi:hypothetical protein